MWKGFAGLLALVFAGGYLAGAFGPANYTRTVERPPAQVMAALADLDLTAEPGAPGATAAAAGGVKPLFRLAREVDRMTWHVMSGDQVATAMTASFEPVDGGKATLIRTNVERGDAPDDRVSPAFRSRGLTIALFSMAIEGKLNRLTSPITKTPEECQQIIDHWRDQAIDAGPRPPAQGFAQGMAEGARNIMKVTAMAQELRRQGCDTNEDGDFKPEGPAGEVAAPALSSQMAPPAGDRPFGTPAPSATPALGQGVDPKPSR